LLARRRELEAELSEELRYHIERQAAQNVEAGMAAGEARRAAVSELGGVEQIKEECRDGKGVQWIEAASQDARFGLRNFRHKAGFTAAVLAILAFGVGSATAIFSIVNGVLLKALPYRAPENLVRVFGAWEHGSREGISPPDFRDYRERS